MRRFRIRRSRHSVGRLQRIRQTRALPRPTGIHLPRPLSAKTKLPQRTVPAQQANEHAGVTDSQIRPDKNRSFCPSTAKTSDSSQFIPRNQHTPRFAPAFNLRKAAIEPGAPAPPWGRAAANRPPPARRGPCPWPNAHRAPGAARAQALPHPGRRAWCAPP